ncbi:MAG: FMN-dependent NADH-azoreductase [Marinosulfonomonas sp.]|nr:MAG: FMN-dependent NADH-azoreductase [Marinosulfonomonas sp.]
MTHTILRIDASARKTDSVSRDLSDRIIARFNDAKVISRDLANPLPLLDQDWVGANFTPADDRSPEQNEKLELSDQLIDELRAADTIVIGVPIYNFGVPAALKAWIDLISRVGETFQYTETGPVGLLEGKRAIIAVASGGTPVGSDMDFASGYLRHLLGFIGISDVTFISADQLAIDAVATLNAAHEAVDNLELAA